MSHMKRFAALGMTLTMVVSILPATAFADTASKTGWVKESGKWYYYDSYGKKVKYTSAYDSSDDKVYLTDGTGARVTKKGWYTSKYKISEYYSKVKFTTKYYLGKGGAVTQGWKKIGKKYYYFDWDGSMSKGTSESKVVNGKTVYYLLGNDGARITKKGWHQVKYSYFDKWSGKVESYKSWYYVKKDGTVQTGWKKIKGKYYYFGYAGSMYYSTSVEMFDENGDVTKVYVVDKNGARITKKGWATVKHTWSYNYGSGTTIDKCKYSYYLNKDGTAVINRLKKIKGKYYYFNDDGIMRTNSTYVDYKAGIRYYFGKSGACTRTEKTKYDNWCES